MIRLRSLPVLLWLAGLTGLAADAQIAPDHHWVGFADKVGCGVDLNDPEAGRQLLSERALDRRARHGKGRCSSARQGRRWPAQAQAPCCEASKHG